MTFPQSQCGQLSVTLILLPTPRSLAAAPQPLNGTSGYCSSSSLLDFMALYFHHTRWIHTEKQKKSIRGRIKHSCTHILTHQSLFWQEAAAETPTHSEDFRFHAASTPVSGVRGSADQIVKFAAHYFHSWTLSEQLCMNHKSSLS